MNRLLMLFCLCFLAGSLACATLRAPSTPAPSLESPFTRPSPGATMTPYQSPTPNISPTPSQPGPESSSTQEDQ
jgi:hypothetical protein